MERPIPYFFRRYHRNCFRRLTRGHLVPWCVQKHRLWNPSSINGRYAKRRKYRHTAALYHHRCFRPLVRGHLAPWCVQKNRHNDLHGTMFHWDWLRHRNRRRLRLPHQPPLDIQSL